MDKKKEFKSVINIFFLGIVYSIGCFNFGYSMGVYNELFKPFINKFYPNIKTDSNIYDVSEFNRYQSLVNLFLMIGAILGSFTGGIIMKKLGVFKTEIIRNILIIVGLLIFLFHGFVPIYIARLVVGYMCGLSNVTISTLIEDNIPNHYKDYIGALIYFWITIGIIVSNIWSIIFDDKIADYYHFIILFPIIIDGVRLIIFLIFYRFESPFWNYFNNSKNSKSNIKKYLKFIYKKKYVKINYNEFLDNVEMLKKNNKNNKKSESFFSKSYRTQLIIGIVLNVINQLTGVNVLILYSKSIFEQFGNAEKYLTFLVSIFNFLGALFLMFLGKYFGKRKTIWYGLYALSFGVLLFSFGVAFDIKIIQPIGIYIFMFHFAISIGGNLYPYLAAILPSNGLSFTLGIQWFFTALVSYFSNQLIAYAKLELFLIFSILGFGSFLYLHINMIEITGLEKGQIFLLYNKQKKLLLKDN